MLDIFFSSVALKVSLEPQRWQDWQAPWCHFLLQRNRESAQFIVAILQCGLSLTWKYYFLPIQNWTLQPNAVCPCCPLCKGYVTNLKCLWLLMAVVFGLISQLVTCGHSCCHRKGRMSSRQQQPCCSGQEDNVQRNSFHWWRLWAEQREDGAWGFWGKLWGCWVTWEIFLTLLHFLSFKETITVNIRRANWLIWECFVFSS